MVIRILVADDHALIREQLREILSNIPGAQVVAEVADGESAVRRALEVMPDVVLMDIRMPRLNGIEATRQLLASAGAAAAVKVIALSLYADRQLVSEALRAGAAGYLL